MRERAQAVELLLLASRVGCRHPVLRLQHADLLGRAEALGEEVDERGVDVVDAAAESAQGLERLGVIGARCGRDRSWRSSSSLDDTARDAKPPAECADDRRVS